LLSRDCLEEGLSSFLRAASAEDIYRQLVKCFEWIPDEPGLAEVRSTVVNKLIDIGLRRGVTAQDCEKAAVELYTRVEQVAIDPNRPALTQLELVTIFDRFTQLQVPRAAFADPSVLVQHIVGEMVVPWDAGAAPTLQAPAPLADRFPAPMLAARRWRRESLITRISDIVALRGAVHVHGGVGIGKTTLVRQAVEGGTETILWADFRRWAEASMAASTCSELRRAVEGAPAPTAVIMDDFNIKASLLSILMKLPPLLPPSVVVISIGLATCHAWSSCIHWDILNSWRRACLRWRPMAFRRSAQAIFSKSPKK
jgi:hypothetical protein